MTENNPDKADKADAKGAVRLTRRVAGQLNCSRSTAEQFIENGCVRVQGQVVQTPGARVASHQSVTVAQDAPLPDPTPVTLLLHKPAGFVAGLAPPDGPQAIALLQAATHWAEDTADIRLLPRHLRRLECFTPLPTAACGLLVYTQDPRIARKLAQDMAALEQECIVQVAGTIAPDGLQRLCHGPLPDGRPLPPIRPIRVSWQSETRLRFALKGLRPGQIPAMCAAVGLSVLVNKRIRIGRVALAKLPEGQWRYLQAWERF